MQPTLLVLAAGMGSRYGGLKQLEPVGPAGETVLDYAVHDALSCGFGRLVFVVRRRFQDTFRTQVAGRYESRVPVELACQELEELPPGFTVPAGRTKPWGTGHAVWCARHHLREPFAVLNADDFYGRDALRQLAHFLSSPSAGGDPVPTGCLVGYRLDATLSPHGSVSRGICDVAPDGMLRSVVEHTAIAADDAGLRSTTPEEGRRLTGQETVSMNCWGLPLQILPPLEEQLVRFLESRGKEPGAEFYLPDAVGAMIAGGVVRIRVLPTSDTWFGVTYREDVDHVRNAIRKLVDSGAYPRSLA